METNSEVFLLANYNKGNFGGAGPSNRQILKFCQSFEDLLFEGEEMSCQHVLA
jgi:hypothetical protein